MNNGFFQELQKRALLQALTGDVSSDDTGSATDFGSIDATKFSPTLNISSVREAEALVDSMPVGKNLSAVAEYITDPDNSVCGKPAEFHNLLSSYLRAGDYRHALAIGEYALSLYPYDVDILADTIQAAGGSAQFAVGYKHIATAEKINKDYWNWRLFIMIAEFFIMELSSCSPDEFDSVYSKGFAICEDYIKYLPLDERAYNQQAEYYIKKNKLAEAREVLERAIYDEIAGTDGTLHHIVAPQCCVTLIDDILSATTEYEHIIEIAEKGVQFTAQHQPSARMGFFRYSSALAKDAMIVRDRYKNKQTIQEALREYQCAFDLNGEMHYGKTIQERYAALSQNSQNPVTDMPLIKRPLYTVPESKDD